ncbi:MAG: hypothetical protein ACOYN0_14435 [Phycisphaerales bacterium]
MSLAIFPVPLMLMLWGAYLWERAAAAEFEERTRRRGGLVIRAGSERDRRIGLLAATGAFWAGVCSLILLAWLTGDLWKLRLLAGWHGWGWGGCAGVLAFAGAASIVVGARFDPARGRRRCAGCWYDFAGAEMSAPCPECGRVHRSERELRRTRRSWRLGAVGMGVLLLSSVVLNGARIVRGGWVGAIPTTVLIAAFEWLPNEVVRRGHPSGETLADRVLRAETYAWQKTWLLARAKSVLSGATTVEVAGRCKDVAPLGSVYAAPRVETVGLLLNDAMRHAGDRQRVTVDAVHFSVMMAAACQQFGWEEWLGANRQRLHELIPTMGMTSGAFLSLIVWRAPLTGEWLVEACAFDRQTAPGFQRYYLNQFVRRIDGIAIWADEQSKGMSAAERAVLLRALGEIGAGGFDWPTRRGTLQQEVREALLAGLWDSEPTVRNAAATALLECTPRHEETRRAIIGALEGQTLDRSALVVAIEAAADGEEFAPWVLCDGGAEDPACRVAAERLLSRARGLPEWERSVERALQRGTLPGQIEAALREESRSLAR